MNRHSRVMSCAVGTDRPAADVAARRSSGRVVDLVREVRVAARDPVEVERRDRIDVRRQPLGHVVDFDPRWCVCHAHRRSVCFRRLSLLGQTTERTWAASDN